MSLADLLIIIIIVLFGVSGIRRGAAWELMTALGLGLGFALTYYYRQAIMDLVVDLTDPGWQDLPDATPDADGYFSIAMSCIDSFIVLEVNGIGAAHVTDQDFSSGDSGLAVWAGSTPNGAGYYAQAAFDDFSVALP